MDLCGYNIQIIFFQTKRYIIFTYKIDCNINLILMDVSIIISNGVQIISTYRKRTDETKCAL